MINILLCGNKKVFDGALTQLISMTNKTSRQVNYYIFTMDVSDLNPNYVKITEEQIEFLRKVSKSKNPKNEVHLIDVTEIYNREFRGSPNETAYCTPYTLIRIFADQVENIPEKILYLDADIMINGDISELFDIDVSEYEYAAVKEKYGSLFLFSDYINAGVLLFNLKKIKETGLLEKARDLIRKKKLIFADQDAIYYNTTKKLLLPSRFNEQSKFNDKKTLLCHFAKRLILYPYPKIANFKQWDIKNIHKFYRCHMFDKDLEEYQKLKKELEVL